MKLSDEMEAEIETLMDAEEDQLPRPVAAAVGTVTDYREGGQKYLSYLKTTVKNTFHGLKVVLDCANGAAYALAPQLLRDLGAETIVLAHQPDGLNINEGCGFTHPENLQKVVVEQKADLGLAFDGDANRLIAVYEQGNIVDGDQILFILAAAMSKDRRLKHNTVVSTVMSNIGFFKALLTNGLEAKQTNGLEAKQTKVGDRYVMEEMMSGGYNLGGEQSGHIILLDYNTTGDGMLSAIQLLDTIKTEGKALSQLASQMRKYPQLLVNVQVEDKTGWDTNETIQAAIRYVEERLGDSGRVLVRASGTESLIRVMSEGPNEDDLKQYVIGIADVIKQELTPGVLV